MGKVQQHLLVAAAFLSATSLGSAGKFYDDDPLLQMPKPISIQEPQNRKLSDMYDFLYMTFSKPGEKHAPGTPIPAQAVNTLGEVPDSEWYTNRHGKRRMSIEELTRGPGNMNSPAMDGPWLITHAKTEGVTPGFRVKDSKGRSYQIKFDTPANAEQGTGADVMGSKFYYALGYNTPENYLVYFTPDQLKVGDRTMFVDSRGVERPMKQSDVDGVLSRLPRDFRGQIRAVASLYLQGKPVGPFRYHGTRSDDPNDTVLHEHRRDLRGLRVFAAWTNHNDSKSLNSLDMVVEEGGARHIKHHLIDFSAAFGAEAFQPKSPRAGYVPLFDWPSSAKNFLSFGFYLPKYMRAHHPYVEEIGRLESEAFEPDEWVGNYYNPAFANLLPDDGFWAAKQVMTFTEPEVRALVMLAEYSSEKGNEYLVQSLMGRREKIGRAYFSKVLPLDDFAIKNGRLSFDDLAVKYGFEKRRTYQYEWARFDNVSASRSPIPEAVSDTLPATPASGFLVARIHGGEARKFVDVFIRAQDGQPKVVGIERHW